MRHYKTHSIGELIKKGKSEMEVFKTLDRYKELKEVWEMIPDKILQKLHVDLIITSDNILQIICFSPVVLSYVTQRRKLIEKHMATFVQQYTIAKIEIRLK